MDPSTYKHLSATDKSDAKSLILSEKSLINSVKINRESESASPSSETGNLSNSVIDQLAIMCGYDPNPQESESYVFDLNKEFNLFESTCIQAEGFSKYWQTNSSELSILTAFVKKYSAISASSVPTEACFSVAHFIQRKERRNLSSKSLRYLMVLRESLTEKHRNYLQETN